MSQQYQELQSKRWWSFAGSRLPWRSICSACFFIGLLLILGFFWHNHVPEAQAYTINDTTYGIADFATGFSWVATGPGIENDIGPIGVAFDNANNLFVSNAVSGDLFKFSSAGGAADANHYVGNIGGAPKGIAFSSSGRLYVAVSGQPNLINGMMTKSQGSNPGAGVYEVSPTNEQIIRSLTVNIPVDGALQDLIVDPISGDLFLSILVNGSGGLYSQIERISGYDNGGPGTPSIYATIFSAGIDGMYFAPDGTLYVAGATEVNGVSNGVIYVIGGTGTRQQPALVQSFTTQPVPNDGIAGVVDASGHLQYLFANRNDGTITRYDVSNFSSTNPNVPSSDIITGGTRGDFVVIGPDHCLYLTQTATVAKLTNFDGTCSFASPSPTPTPSLSPSPSPGWFQANGHIMSLFNQTGQPTKYGINETVPGGKFLDGAVNAIVAAFSDITTTEGSATPDYSKVGPPPAPMLKNYITFNNSSYIGAKKYTYAYFWNRVPASPSPTLLDGYTAVAPASGIYQTGTFDLNGADWHVSNGTHIIAFVSNSLTIERNIFVDPGGFLAFFVGSGGINIQSNVSEVDGEYFTDGILCTMCTSAGTIDLPSPTPSPTAKPTSSPTPSPSPSSGPAQRDAQRKSDLSSIALALSRFKSRYGFYPRSSTWESYEPSDATNFGFIVNPSSWIFDQPTGNTLTPGFISTLPVDPLGGASTLCGSPWKRDYLYTSNGTDYKVLATCSPEETWTSADPYYDPVRPTTSWQVSTPGGISF